MLSPSSWDLLFTMPARCAVCFIPQQSLHPEDLKPTQLHGVFFSLLEEDLGNEMHKGRIKPFALRFQSLMNKREDLDRFFLEVSLLRDDLFPRFLSSLMLHKAQPYLGDLSIKYLKKPFIKEKDVMSYESIYEIAEPNNTLVMDFLTPTTFKRGDFDHPLPDPRLIFKGLIRKWQWFSDFKIDIDLRDLVDNRIHLSGAWIRTRKVELSEKAKITGFRGRVVLFIDSGKERELKWINALAKFGEFAGVGRKTTMGFGTVRMQDPEVAEGGDPSAQE